MENKEGGEQPTPSPLQLKRKMPVGIMVEMHDHAETELPLLVHFLTYLSIVALFATAYGFAFETGPSNPLVWVVYNVPAWCMGAAGTLAIIQSVLAGDPKKKSNHLKGELPKEVQEAIDHIVKHHL